jgi:DNA-binding MarR family transcriptional regulator
MTKIVARLEERGLVVREIDPTDRRVAWVRVTPAAADVLAELRTRRDEYLASRLGQLSAFDRNLIEAALPALERLAEVDS